MNKLYIDIKKELLDYNNKSITDFEDKEFLRCKCPYCPPYKSPALSIHKSLNFAVCFRCGTLFINKGIHKDELIDSLVNIKTDSINLSNIKDTPSDLLFDLYDKVPPEGDDYLTGRNSYVKDWTKYRLGHSDNEIFIPYFYLNNFIFYQIRYKSGDRRYNMPRLPSPIYIPSEWDIGKSTIICEGPFDAIALDCSVGDKFNIVALVGKEITTYKKRLLDNLSTNKYYIMLDESVLSSKIKGKLENSSIIPTYGDDPEELLNSMGIDEFRNYIDTYTNDESRISFRYTEIY